MSDAASTTTYAYNGDGDRVSQDVDGTLTTYTLDTATPLTRLIAETTGPDTTFTLHGLGLVAQSDGSTTEYFSADGLGSVRQLTDSTGSILLNQTFDPYGNPYVRTGSGDTRFGFTGEQVDGNGLVYLRARYYQPEMGRFLNADPSRQERNPYQYGLGNPAGYTDPTGLDPLDQVWQKEFATKTGREIDIYGYDVPIRLFAIAYPNEYKWDKFYNTDGQVDKDKRWPMFHIPPVKRSWRYMPDALERLAVWYSASETIEFVRDVGTLFGGLKNRFEESSIWGAVSYSGNPARDWVYIRPYGLLSEYTGGEPDANVHHWAWGFVLGYARGRLVGSTINTGHEWEGKYSDLFDQYAGFCYQVPEGSLVVAGMALADIFQEQDPRADLLLGQRGIEMGQRLRQQSVTPIMVRQVWNEVMGEIWSSAASGGGSPTHKAN